jgi:hypothetical protein
MPRCFVGQDVWVQMSYLPTPSIPQGTRLAHADSAQSEDFGKASRLSDEQRVETVRIADEIDRIAARIDHYCSIPHSDLSVLLALWVVNTYTYRNFWYCGYLWFRSATSGCGKTQLMELIGLYSKGSPTLMVEVTPAVLFRGGWDVMLIDEVDDLNGKNREGYAAVVSILNAGFASNGAVPRTEKVDGKFEVVKFSVYGPKAFAGIEGLPDTLSSRTFAIRLQRAKNVLPRLNRTKVIGEAEEIQRKLALWAAEYGEALKSAHQKLPDVVPELAKYNARFQDISEPLLVIADQADQERPGGPLVRPRLLRALEVTAARRVPSEREDGLLTVLAFLDGALGGKAHVFVSSEELLSACRATEELGWITSKKALAGFLDHFDLHPREGPNGKVRGYSISRSWVDDWKSRYSRKEGDMS